ncbi:MAG: HAD-IA family hydrolase [Gammaproteobacteria bacterium]|nr:HAD-IA family hydrolase [Gammaproteobacteria bacterium]MYE53255.1 HAD-IA family hydrolase [Gammaproteobacteria bacterium]MYF10641.1 HAD-IA family hydrolase [Gammaproteobacteria bacterium]MYF50998.1 HAD-IA family hydrolase [Gammaproteobacteria bacterium]MYH14388.1 HAD-IA family hydrolase [Gammaproteobacteria bacterium]
MGTIEAVIWDFGGVLTTSPFEAFNRYEQAHGLPNDFIRGINATNPEGNAWAQFESAQLTLEEFDAAFAAEAAARGCKVPGRDVIALLSGDLRPRMVEVLKRCKARFKVACITNNVKSGTGPAMATSDAKREQTEAVMDLFDLVVESSVEGIRKPNPEIYRLTCARLGVAPDACAFLDDLGINLKPARQLGMQTIKVLEEDQAIQELAEITGIEMPAA